MKLSLGGIHHVTAITSSSEKIYHFFTKVLSLRLAKKTVNQDDINTYHLFFTDDLGSPGADMTFFDFKDINRAFHGNDEISKTSFRVKDDKALKYWLKRFKHYNVKHSDIENLFDYKVIYFYDFDDQPYVLFSDENNTGVAGGVGWKNGSVPEEYSIYGLGPSFINVSRFSFMDNILTDVFFMKQTKKYNDHYLYEMASGGTGASLVIVDDKSTIKSVQGYGGVHHVAFRVKDKKELDDWLQHLRSVRAVTLGHVDRFYFESVYTRLYPNVLFELATDGPGFIDGDETYETLGETLALPPKFKDKRSYVESVVKPLDTSKANKVQEKEYFND